MKKLATLAALTMAGLALAAPAASAAGQIASSPDATGGLTDGLELSPADLALKSAGKLPVVGHVADEVEAVGTNQIHHPGLSGQINP
ncbi:hypothetical protein ACIG0C_02630 [Kitasatospora aureofaciens]|nr:hypothetical protein [Kitasatospora aureofaciens]ARF79232.1 hypothetical protein B6264_10170 [Kitasatospora aureofaciens]OEV34413.1 hypothetical protein HS99_0035990 [Kitasatospora aureofaciens]QEV00431.1 hypothetical protein CP971_15135 [Streptomyces viridifaciens]UKZ06672.1 hypothetical protein BOQ63_022030 [Streptomyces viridifaciens]